MSRSQRESRENVMSSSVCRVLDSGSLSMSLTSFPHSPVPAADVTLPLWSSRCRRSVTRRIEPFVSAVRHGLVGE